MNVKSFMSLYIYWKYLERDQDTRFFGEFLALSYGTILSQPQKYITHRLELNEMIYILFAWKMNLSFTPDYAQDMVFYQAVSMSQDTN